MFFKFLASGIATRMRLDAQGEVSRATIGIIWALGDSQDSPFVLNTDTWNLRHNW